MTADQWITAYGESHQNPTNKLIHFIFVPTIMFTLVGLLWSIPMPAVVAENVPYLNVATLFVLFCLGFYVRISVPLAIGMLVWVSLMLAGIIALQQGLHLSNGALALVMVAVFAVSWVFQFVGHNIEGKKPSFLNDLKFLLIGPMWIMGFLFRKLGLKY